MNREEYWDSLEFKATDFMEYKGDIWEFFRQHVRRIKEDGLNVQSIKVDTRLYEKLKELRKTRCIFMEHSEELTSIFGIKLEIKDEVEDLKKENRALEEELGILITIKSSYKKFLKELKEEVYSSPVDVDYLKTVFGETQADWISFVREDWESEN